MYSARNHPVKIVIASQNMHKIREIRAILHKIHNIDILCLLDFPSYIPSEEGINSYEENAITKATDAAKALNTWVIAEDSGLIVPSLGGHPGVLSARYAGKNSTDKDNRKKLLEEMLELTDQDRNAYFECCIAIASPDKLIKSVCATCEGQILTQEKGGGGFGYDPLFAKHEYSKSFAELDESVKNRISHRRKALDKIMPTLESLTY
jgi:XTP/dITP diphosphohydrolase